MRHANRIGTWLLCLSVTATVGLTGCADSDGNIDGLSGGGGTTTNPSSCEFDGSQLCAIPTVGPAIVAGAGGDCDIGDPGQLTPAALCPVPGIGPPLVEAVCGFTCPDSGGGGEPPLSIEELCAVPQLGPAIVEGAGGSCGGVAPPPGGGGMCLPNQCDPGGNGCLSDIPGFNALVCP